MADYDLNAIAQALATAMAVDSWEIDGQLRPVSVYADVPGLASTPALAIELDDITYDVSMGAGADEFTFLAYLLVSSADAVSGQRLQRQLLSRGGAALSVKAALERDTTLGGLVSYAHMVGTRTIGTINYGNVAYLGATLEVRVISNPEGA